MKMYTLVAALTLAMPALAQQQPPPQQPQQQTIGHVLSAETHRTQGSSSTSTYDQATGKWTYGTSSGGAVRRDTEIQVGNLVYESSQIHKDVVVGKDYPVVFETDKHGNAKKLGLIVGDKTYTYRITGTREVKPG
jgi:hypothetical protein